MKLGEFELNEPVPELKDPHVLAVLRPWIDVGSVGTLSLSRLERHLRATEVGRLYRPGYFYDFTRYRPRSLINEGKREVTIPNTIVRHAAREDGSDLLLVHLLEPHLHGEDYTESFTELLKHFGVKRYSLIGAMYDTVPHTRPLLVSSSGVGGDMETEHQLVRARTSTYEGPTTLLSLIPQEAASMGMETRTYVVHLPQYFQVDEDFQGTARLMEILCALYNLPNRLIDFDRGREQYNTVQNMVTNEGTSVSGLLQRLEERYDREQRAEEPPPPPLSSDIEDFLRDINEGFDSPSS
ncbi:MAG: PAC2 family protein [Dehalococcoidia bacterium]